MSVTVWSYGHKQKGTGIQLFSSNITETAVITKFFKQNTDISGIGLMLRQARPFKRLKRKCLHGNARKRPRPLSTTTRKHRHHREAPPQRDPSHQSP